MGKTREGTNGSGRGYLFQGEFREDRETLVASPTMTNNAIHLSVGFSKSALNDTEGNIGLFRRIRPYNPTPPSSQFHRYKAVQPVYPGPAYILGWIEWVSVEMAILHEGIQSKEANL